MLQSRWDWETNDNNPSRLLGIPPKIAKNQESLRFVQKFTLFCQIGKRVPDLFLADYDRCRQARQAGLTAINYG
jgi:hypothetical protein